MRSPRSETAELMRAEVLSTRGAGPELAYVPGIDGSGELLLGTAERLERSFRLTRFRYDGGASGNYHTLAASVADGIARVTGGRALVLAESFGVAVALRLALDHPERVAGLALVNGFARFHDRLGIALTRGVFALAPEAWIRAARARFAQRGLFAPRRDEAALRALLALSGGWFDARYRARLAWIQALDLCPELDAIRCPVALFAADKDRVVSAVPCAREIAARIAGAELNVLRSAGHVVLPLAEEPWEVRLLALAARTRRDVKG
jgi:pimeloyl-ACP methyl ester carboxylesterase